MLAVVLVHDGQHNADEDVHTDKEEDDEEEAEPAIVVVSWHPA